MADQHVSPSRISTLNHCSQQHHYKYTERLQKIGPEVEHLSLGKAIHTAIENMYNGVVVPRMEPGEATYHKDYNAAIDAFGLFRAFKDRGMETLDTEIKFDVPLEEFPGWTLQGIIDHVVRIDGAIWIGDHKSTKQAWSFEHTNMNLQHKLYELVVPDLYDGEKAAGSFYNFIKMGSRKEVSYADVSRVMLPASDAGLVSAYDEMAKAIHRIESGEHSRNVGRHCKWCDFQAICSAEYFGQDAAFVRSEYYESRDKDPEPVDLEVE